MRDECYDRDNNNTIGDPGCYNVHVSLARVSKSWQLMRDGDEECLRCCLVSLGKKATGNQLQKVILKLHVIAGSNLCLNCMGDFYDRTSTLTFVSAKNETKRGNMLP